MASETVYVDNFINYLKNFVANIRSDDPLPVRAPSYRVTESEIDGQILDIVYHYLNQRDCPPYLRSAVAHKVWTEMRNPEVNGNEDCTDGFDMPDQHSHFFEPVKLIQEVASRANKVLIDMHSQLSQTEIESLPRYLPVSQYAIKNTRRKMEDRHVIIQDLNTLYNLNCGYPHSYYAVFDGHAGNDAAVYAAAHLHQYLIQNPLYEIDPVSALKHAFHITDTNFCKNGKTERERLKGGTTAVVALVREKRLVVAWLGDSQALLVKKRNPLQVVQPHKPECPEERQRIENLGGCVININGTWRVLGQLAVSRAIGDLNYKPFVSSECDIKSLEINGDEDFMILACDGLWDTLPPETAVNIVYSYLAVHNGETDGVGRCLVEAARSLRSDDNITAVVVFLRPVATLMEEEAARIEQGEISAGVDPFVAAKNAGGGCPQSIGAIFSPPTPEEISGIAPSRIQPVQTTIQTTEPVQSEKQEESTNAAPDSDSDEGVGVDISLEKGGDEFPDLGASALVETAVPTDAEVDAALAELDSIPDGVCEVADGEDIGEEDSDDDVGNWHYFNMKPQPERQQEDDLLFANEPQDNFVAPVTNVDEESIDQMNLEAPGSPKTVEGFVTSVELNTPEESFNTNLAINQSTGYFNAGQLEQNSGPFSVYVSSSPEPASIEVPPQQQQSTMESGLEDTVTVVKSSENADPINSPGVEIVHAQSMVEVVAPDSSNVVLSPGSPIQIEPPLIGADGKPIAIPDIMTQSMTGDTHPDLFSAPLENQHAAAIQQTPDIETEVKSEPDLFNISNEPNLKEVEGMEDVINPIEKAEQEFIKLEQEEAAILAAEAIQKANEKNKEHDLISSEISPIAYIEQLPMVEPALIEEPSPAEKAPPLDEANLLFESHLDEPNLLFESHLDEQTSMDKALPLDEANPLVELHIHDEQSSVDKALPLDEANPLVESHILDDSCPMVESHLDEPSPVVESHLHKPSPVVESHLDEPSPVVESHLDEPSPVVELHLYEQSPVVELHLYEQSPVVERSLLDEPSPMVKQSLLDEPSLVVKQSLLDEPSPVVEPSLLDEPSPVVEPSLLDEPSPVVESSLLDEPSELVETSVGNQSSVIEEPSPVVETLLAEEQNPIVESPPPVKKSSPVIESKLITSERTKPMEQKKTTTPKPAPRTSSKPAGKTAPSPTATSKALPTKSQPSKAQPRTGITSTRPKVTSTAPKSEEKRTSTTRTSSHPKTATSRPLRAPTTSNTRTSPMTPAKTSTSRPTAASAPRQPLTTAPKTSAMSRRPAASDTVAKTSSTRTTTASSTKPSTAQSTVKRTTSTSSRASALKPETTPREPTRPSALNKSSVTNTSTASKQVTSTTTTKRPITSPRPTSARTTLATTKDSKNTTNKILSTSRSVASTTTTASSRLSSAPRSVVSKTSTTIPQRRTTTATTKPGLKSKVDAKSPLKKTPQKAPAAANGENKIVEEESTFEVKEKLVEESIPEKVSSPTIPDKSENILSEPNSQVLVNGDH